MREVVPMLEDYGRPIVLCGHSHGYGAATCWTGYGARSTSIRSRWRSTRG